VHRRQPSRVRTPPSHTTVDLKVQRPPGPPTPGAPRRFLAGCERRGMGISALSDGAVCIRSAGQQSSAAVRVGGLARQRRTAAAGRCRRSRTGSGPTSGRRCQHARRGTPGHVSVPRRALPGAGCRSR
jgi:hypothetical protein